MAPNPTTTFIHDLSSHLIIYLLIFQISIQTSTRNIIHILSTSSTKILEDTRGYSRISNGAKFEYSNFVTFRLNDKRQFVQILWITAVVKNFSLTSFDFPRFKNITNSSKSFSSTSSRRSLHKCTRDWGFDDQGRFSKLAWEEGIFLCENVTRKDSHRGLSRTERDAKTSGMRDVIRRKTGPDAV